MFYLKKTLFFSTPHRKSWFLIGPNYYEKLLDVVFEGGRGTCRGRP